MAYSTYLPLGPLVALAPSGGSPIVFDQGRNAVQPYDREALPDYGDLIGVVSPVDLTNGVLAPFTNEQVTWQVSVGAGGSGNPYSTFSTAWVQDVNDLLLTAFYTAQLCTLYAYALGKGVIVSNTNCRVVRLQNTEAIVTFLKLNLTCNCVGLWTTAGSAMFASQSSVPHGSNILITFQGINTSWTSSTTLGISGGTGASIVSQSINGQLITATINPGSASGTLTFSNSMDANTATVTVS